MVTARRRVVVIGAGFAGLAAACHLAGGGHDVTVIEREDRPGGRAGRRTRDGFSFDTGPAVLTMPDLLAATFRAAGTEMSDALELRPLDPAYRACFADGSTVRLRHGREAMAEEIRTVCGSREEAAYLRFCDWLERLYRVEMPAFIDRDYDRPWDLLATPGALARLVRLGALRRLSRVVDGYFRDERLRRLFSFQAMYAGLAPHQALAVFAVITYMDSVRGVYFPVGGVAAVPAALAAAAEKAGARFRYGTGAAEVVHTGAVRGVRLRDGELIACDAAVVTADLPTAYRELLPGLPLPRAVRRAAYSPSALVWHVGVDGSPPPEAAHHNIHFGREWRSAFTSLLRDGVPMPDPSVLVTVPTLTDPDLAPAGSSVLYVLEPVPHLGGAVDWRRHRGPARDRLAALIQRCGYPSDIRVEELVDPTDWQRQGMANGTPFSFAHRFWQSGPFRPANVDRRVHGLVFAGSGTVPGVGVPMVLVSGRLAAERVKRL